MGDATRYRPLGIGPASVPAIGYSGYAPDVEQAYRSWGSLSSRMEQLASNFFEMSGKAMKDEGEQMGAQLAPTEDQLKMAMEAGQPVMLPGQGDQSIKGRAAFKSATAVASDRLETLARKDIANIAFEAKVNDLSPGEVAAKFNKVAEGYSSALAEQNPLAATKLKAQIAQVGNAHWESYTTSWVGRAREAAKASAMKDVDGVIDGVWQTIETGGQAVRDPKTGEVFRLSVNDSINMQKDNLRKKMMGQFTAAEIETAVARFDKEADAAKLGAVLDWMQDPRFQGKASAPWRMIASGQIDDPRIAAVWGSMEPKQRMEARKAAMGVLNQELSITRTAQENADRNDRNTAKRLEGDLADVLQNLPLARTEQEQNDLITRREKILDQLKIVDGAKYKTELNATRTNPGGANDVFEERRLRAGIVTGSVGMADILNAGVSETSREQLTALFKARQDKDFVSADKYLQDKIGKPGYNIANPSKADREADLQYRDLNSKLLLAQREHELAVAEYMKAIQSGDRSVKNPGRFDPMDWAIKAHADWWQGKRVNDIMTKEKRLKEMPAELQTREGLISAKQSKPKGVTQSMIEEAETLYQQIEALQVPR